MSKNKADNKKMSKTEKVDKKKVSKVDSEDEKNVNKAPPNKSDNKASSSRRGAPIFKYNQVDLKNIEVSEFDRSGKQPMAFINYNDSDRNASVKLIIQTDEIKITSHGIPKLDGPDSKNDFYPDDTKREFMKVPLDPEQKGCEKLRKFMERVDEHFGSDEFRKKLFGKRADRYQYMPTIKSPPEVDDEDDKKKKSASGKDYPRMDYVKMKFNVTREHENLTRLIKVEKQKNDDGEIVKKIRTSIEAKTITDIANEIRRGSEIKFLFSFSKLWANATPPQGSKFMNYGISFKFYTIEYVPSTSSGLDYSQMDLLEDEEDDVEDSAVSSKKSKNTKKDNIKSKESKIKLDDEDYEEDEDKDEDKGKDEDDEDDKEDEKMNKKDDKKKGKKTSGEMVESKKSNKKNKNDTEEEEIDVKNSSKKSNKKNKNEDEDEVDEEAEDGEIEIKPKKKLSKSKKSKSEK